MNKDILRSNETIKDIADILGEEVCNKIINTYKKQAIYIPIKQNSDKADKLIALLGKESFEKLSYYFGGLTIYIPEFKLTIINDRNKKIINDFYNNRLTTKEIGKKYNLSQRKIQDILRKNKIANK